MNIRINRNKSNEIGRMSSQHVIQFMIILCIRPAIFELTEYLGISTEIRDSEELDN